MRRKSLHFFLFFALLLPCVLGYTTEASMARGPAITLWFDDAWRSQYDVAYPMMKQHGFKGAIAVPTNFIEGKGVMNMLGYKVTKEQFMTWDELLNLQKQGWEIDSHTMSHSCNLDFYTPKVLKKEFSDSRKVLQSKGFEANNFVMPCGTWKSSVPFLSEEAEKYYDSYRSLEPQLNFIPLKDSYDIKSYFLTNLSQLSEVEQWIKHAKDSHAWLILTFHIIDNTHDKYAVTPVFFKKILELVDASNIPVVIPNQIIKGKSDDAS